jgi:hypothetical protein
LVVMTDPTLLSVQDLTPAGTRGDRAPLHRAFARAGAVDEPVIVLLDDLDPAAAGFWLPELARCQRQPSRYDFPPNLLFLAVVEADAGQMGLSAHRAGELFPLLLDNSDPNSRAPARPDPPFDLTRDMIADPASSTSWPARVAAFERSLGLTFKADEAKSLAASFSDFLQHCKGGGAAPRNDGSLGSQLARSAGRLMRGPSGDN